MLIQKYSYLKAYKWCFADAWKVPPVRALTARGPNEFFAD